jgi:hypothetical protein
MAPAQTYPGGRKKESLCVIKEVSPWSGWLWAKPSVKD